MKWAFFCLLSAMPLAGDGMLLTVSAMTIIILINDCLPELARMYVCVCRAVTDGDIRDAVAEGCCTMRDLRNTLDVATQCGRCALSAREVLNDALAEQAFGMPVVA